MSMFIHTIIESLVSAQFISPLMNSGVIVAKRLVSGDLDFFVDMPSVE